MSSAGASYTLSDPVERGGPPHTRLPPLNNSDTPETIAMSAARVNDVDYPGSPVSVLS